MSRVRVGVIHHEHCTDGAAAAWSIAHLAGAADTAHFPAPPARAPEAAVERDLVFVVDTCLPADELARLDARTPLGVWVLDHHASNQAIVEAHAARTGRGVFDQRRSGAGLAWDEGGRILAEMGLRGAGAEPRPGRPWFIDYIEDRDLWRHVLPDSLSVNAALSARERTVAGIEALWRETRADADPKKTIARYREAGHAIQVGIADAVRVATRGAVPFELGGVRGLACASAVYASEIGHALTGRGAVAAIWHVTSERGALVAQISFRSRDALPDCARLAEAFGGGGHRNASGAVLPLAEWVGCLRP